MTGNPQAKTTQSTRDNSLFVTSLLNLKVFSVTIHQIKTDKISCVKVYSDPFKIFLCNTEDFKVLQLTHSNSPVS